MKWFLYSTCKELEYVLLCFTHLHFNCIIDYQVLLAFLGCLLVKLGVGRAWAYKHVSLQSDFLFVFITIKINVVLLLMREHRPWFRNGLWWGPWGDITAWFVLQMRRGGSRDKWHRNEQRIWAGKGVYHNSVKMMGFRGLSWISGVRIAVGWCEDIVSSGLWSPRWGGGKFDMLTWAGVGLGSSHSGWMVGLWLCRRL